MRQVSGLTLVTIKYRIFLVSYYILLIKFHSAHRQVSSTLGSG